MPALISLADFDMPTRSASGFLLRWVVPRLEPIHLYSIFARRLPFQLSAPQSDIIIAMGHGQEDAFTGQNEAVIWQVGKYNPREVEGKVIKLVSCQTGVALGPDLIDNGAVSYAGYTDDFIWVCDGDKLLTPWADDLAQPVVMPVVDSINALLDGKTAEEAFCIEIEGYTRNAEWEEDELIKSCLDFNRKNAVLLGDHKAAVKRRPGLPLPFQFIPPPPIVLPIITE